MTHGFPHFFPFSWKIFNQSGWNFALAYLWCRCWIYTMVSLKCKIMHDICVVVLFCFFFKKKIYQIFLWHIFLPKYFFDQKVLIDWQNCLDAFDYPWSIVYLSCWYIFHFSQLVLFGVKGQKIHGFVFSTYLILFDLANLLSKACLEEAKHSNR